MEGTRVRTECGVVLGVDPTSLLQHVLMACPHISPSPLLPRLFHVCKVESSFPREETQELAESDESPRQTLSSRCRGPQLGCWAHHPEVWEPKSEGWQKPW